MIQVSKMLHPDLNYLILIRYIAEDELMKKFHKSVTTKRYTMYTVQCTIYYIVQCTCDSFMEDLFVLQDPNKQNIQKIVNNFRILH